MTAAWTRFAAVLGPQIPTDARSALVALAHRRWREGPRLEGALYLSSRAVPLWPHDCDQPTEACRTCAPERVAAVERAIAEVGGAALLAELGDELEPTEAPYALVRDGVFVVIPRAERAGAGWTCTVDPAADLARIALAGFAPGFGAGGGRHALYALAAGATTARIELVATACFDPTDGDRAAIAHVRALAAAALGEPGGLERAVRLQQCVDWSRAMFARYPELRSTMMCVAQYWNDNADDECHAESYASVRDTPLFPHPCTYDWDRDEQAAPPENGEWCDRCSPRDRGGFGASWYASTEGFEAFCVEGANQDQEDGERHRPFAIVRRAGDDVALELVGRCRRPGFVLGAGAAPAPWPDARAAALAEEVDARAVLADHLLDVGDPRGELIARELAGGELRDAATATLRAGAIHPLGRVLVVGGARFARGALVHAEVHAATADDVAAVRGAAAWRTVETLRYLPGSRALLDPAMRALREAGEVGVDDLAALAALPALATLQLAIAKPADATRFAACALPRLRHLVVTGADALAALARAPWWPQLERVTLLDEPYGALPAALAEIPIVAWALRDDELARPTGWCAALDRRRARAEIALAGWHASTTLDGLAELVIPAARRLAPAVALVASPGFAPTADDRARLGLDT